MTIRSITLLDGTVVAVGDTVVAHNYKSMGIPTALTRGGREHIVTGIRERTLGGWTLALASTGSLYGYEWFVGRTTEDTVETLRAEVAELKDVLERERQAADEQVRQFRSEVEQAEAAQALEAHRANKAQAAERRAVRLLTYATSLMGSRKRGMVQGFAAGLDSER